MPLVVSPLVFFTPPGFDPQAGEGCDGLWLGQVGGGAEPRTAEEGMEPHRYRGNLQRFSRIIHLTS